MNETQTPVAYLVSEYPSRSHTFIRRERYALQALGVHIEMLAIRRCPEESLKDDSERKEYDATWSILPTPPVKLAKIIGRRLIKSPKSFLNTLFFAVRNRHPGIRNWLWSLFYFIESLILSEKLEKGNARHLHVHFAISSAHIGVLCNKLIKIPWSMTLHGSCDYEFPAGPLLPEKLKSVSFAACVSHYGRSQAMRSIEYKHWPKLKLVRCGIEAQQLLEKPLLNLKTGNNTLYTIGRLSSEKGQLGLLEAFSLITKTNSDVTLNIIGFGPDENLLKSRSQELELDDKINWLGAKTESEVIEHLRHKADILILPSFMEGVPMVLMEAMGNGVNVIAPRIAGIPELVDDNESGLLYHPADWTGLAHCANRLINDKELRTRLRYNAWEKVRDEFCVENSVTQLAELFLEEREPHE